MFNEASFEYSSYSNNDTQEVSLLNDRSPITYVSTTPRSFPRQAEQPSLQQPRQSVVIVRRSKSSTHGKVLATGHQFGSIETWLPELISRFSELSQYEDNWDSYGSRKIQAPACQEFIRFIDMAQKGNIQMPMPTLLPVPGGGLQLELSGEKLELEIEFLPTGEIEYLKTDLRDSDHIEDSMEEGSLDLEDTASLSLLFHWLGS